MASYTVLIVDDDPHIREVLRYALEKEGLTVIEAENGSMGLEKHTRQHPDIVILDIMMPEMNGLDTCREIRRNHNTPILFLSSRDSELDRIIGLEIGGDDYVVKPFSPRELVARVKVMLRRLDQTAQKNEKDNLLAQGALSLNPNSFQVTWNGDALALTATEFNLLQIFMQTPNKVFTRDNLIDADIFRDIVTDRTIDSHIRRLRQKLSNAGCEDAIETVHGFGYKLGSCQ